MTSNELLSDKTTLSRPRIPQSSEKDSPKQSQQPDHDSGRNGGILEISSVSHWEHPQKEEDQHWEHTEEIVCNNPPETNNLLSVNSPEPFPLATVFLQFRLFLGKEAKGVPLVVCMLSACMKHMHRRMARRIAGIKPRVELMLGYWRDDVHRLWVILVVVFARWVVVLQLRGIRRIVEFLELFANL